MEIKLKLFIKYLLLSLIILFNGLYYMVAPAQSTVSGVIIKKDNEQKEVEAAYYAWCKEIGQSKKDPMNLVKFYSPDAILIPTFSNSILLTQEQDFKYFFTSFTQESNFTCTPQKLITQIFDNFAINSGLYTFSFFTKDGKQKKIPARFTFVYKKYAGKWWIVNQHSSVVPRTY